MPIVNFAQGMNLPDGGGWSPDGGAFWVKGDAIYWADGTITSQRAGVFRVGRSGLKTGVNYSKWSEKYRKKILALTLRCAALDAQREAEMEATRCPTCGQLPG